MRQVGAHQALKQMDDDHDDGDGHGDDQVLKLGKRRKKIIWLKAKVYLIGAFCFATQDTKWV